MIYILNDALKGGTISRAALDGPHVRIDFETNAEANALFNLLFRVQTLDIDNELDTTNSNGKSDSL